MGRGMRILFVDDEPQQLASLKATLRRQRKIWEMEFVDNGNEAARLIASKRYDVIVSDLQIPEVNGFELLKLTRDLQPHAVRIVLTGSTDLKVARSAIPVAHQILGKPCPPETLRAV